MYWNNFDEYRNWQIKILNLINSLKLDIKNNVYLKLYNRIKQHNFINEDWLSLYGEDKIYKNSSTIENVYKNSRLIIICYESRSLQETISQNIPTVILYDDFMMRQMRNDNYEMYKILEKSGILFNNFTNFKNFLNTHHDHIDEWWFSSDVQKARNEFSRKFSKIEINPSRFLSKSILNNL